jgi:hypothetical protein
MVKKETLGVQNQCPVSEKAEEEPKEAKDPVPLYSV